MIITIDGPVASGKSSAAKLLAKRLGFYYLQTGLLYRAVAYILLEKQGKRVEDFYQLRAKDLTFTVDLSYAYIQDDVCITYAGENITEFLSCASMDQPASLVSANAYVRQALLPIQRSVAAQYSLVADGRDCGSVVFPQAPYKFFVTASLEKRALRLYNDQKRQGEFQNLQEVMLAIKERDQRDMQRKVAPLHVPQGAIVIDNSEMTLQATVEQMFSYIS